MRIRVVARGLAVSLGIGALFVAVPVGLIAGSTGTASAHHISKFHRMASACETGRTFEVDGTTYVCRVVSR